MGEPWRDAKHWIELAGGVRALVCACGSLRWTPQADNLGETCAECGKASPLTTKAER